MYILLDTHKYQHSNNDCETVSFLNSVILNEYTCTRIYVCVLLYNIFFHHVIMFCISAGRRGRLFCYISETLRSWSDWYVLQQNEVLSESPRRLHNLMCYILCDIWRLDRWSTIWWTGLGNQKLICLHDGHNSYSLCHTKGMWSFMFMELLFIRTSSICTWF